MGSKIRKEVGVNKSVNDQMLNVWIWLTLSGQVIKLVCVQLSVLSKSSQAYQMFSEGKSPTDVAILV